MRFTVRFAVPFVVLLVPGCIGPSEPFSAQHAEDVVEYPNFPGLKVSAILDGGGDTMEVAAMAANTGTRVFRISSVCKPAWSETMTGALGEVYPHGQVGYCHAFGLRDFRPGESVPFTARWNGTLWDLQAEEFVPAPAGDYVWQVAFEAYAADADSPDDTPQHIPVRFTVHVR